MKFDFKLNNNILLKECNGKIPHFIWDRSIIDPLAYVKQYIGKKEYEEFLCIEYVKELVKR